MTFENHIHAIRNIISKGAASKDLRISDRLIGHFLNISRAAILDKYPSDSNWQTICTRLEESSISDICVDCELPASCENLMKSTARVPATVTSTKSPIVVRTIDGVVFSKGNLLNNKFSDYSLTQQTNTKGWFIYNQYLYIYSDRLIPMVLVDGLFASPEEVTALTPCAESSVTDTVCNDSTTLYPIDAKAINAVYELTLKMLSQAYRFGEDSTTDARDLAIQVLQNNRKK